MIHKYRGLTKDGEWVEGWYAKRCYAIGSTGPDMVTDVIYDIDDLIPIEVIPETIGQYTGFKDSKRTKEYPEGQEIYDGDIVKASIYCDEKPQELTVQWLGSGFVIEYEDSESDIVLISEFIGSLEVIGDIHSTPELLGE